MDRPLNATPVPDGALAEQMRAVRKLLQDSLPQMARADAIFWLVQQRYGNSPQIQRMVGQDPLAQRGMQEMRHFGTWHEQLYQPALQLFQTLTQPRPS